jgi:adenylylsulfate kinase-like enzyme
LRRDTRNLYASALRGEIPNVVGVDIPFPEPVSPELVLDNDVDRREFGEMVGRVMQLDVVREALGRE